MKSSRSAATAARRKKKGAELYENKKGQAFFGCSLRGSAFGRFAADNACGSNRYTRSED